MIKTLMYIVTLSAAISLHAQEGLNIGDKVADFNLVNIDGKTVSLSDYKNEKGVVVIFSCNHCPYVVAYEDRIIQLHKDYATKGYPVLTINSNDSTVVPGDSFSNMKKRAADKNFPFPYLRDVDHKTQKQFGAKKTPHVYLLKNTDGEFVVKYIGTIDDSPRDPSAVNVTYLANAIDALLNGSLPNPEVTKAIGCSIKIKK